MSQTSIVQFFKSKQPSPGILEPVKGHRCQSPTSVIDDSMFDNPVGLSASSADEL